MANLSTGRVVVFVAREGIVVGAVETRGEAGARAPQVVELGARRVVILLGATEWISPGTGQPPLRLQKELPRMISQAAVARPEKRGEPVNDIEAIGVAVLEGLRPIAARLHHRIELLPDEPLVEMVLIGFAEDYGPEVWSLRYRIAQDPLRGDYWRTRVLHPQYTQLYPPEKGQPKTLVEVQYPPDAQEPTLLELLGKNDPRVARLKTSDAPLQRASERLAKGEAQKTAQLDATAFLRAALGAIAPSQEAIVLGVIHEQKGLDWVLAPADPVTKAESDRAREPGAPTLKRKPPQ